VDPFAAIMLGGLVLLILALLGLGLFYPGSGAKQLDWRPTRSIEVEVQNEIDDVDQMRDAINERRRRRGEIDLTEEQLRARVDEDLREQARLREGYLAEQDVAQMLAARNERRRRRGLPELSAEEYRAEIEGTSA
jgi:hypothetical protein